MDNWFVALLVAGFSGLVVFFVGGIVQDALWMVSDGFVPDCDKLVDSWRELCRAQNRDYYSGKALIQLFSLIIPFITFLVFLRKL